MLDVEEIPNWNDQSHKSLGIWWQTMAKRGLAFHPDDAPETIVYMQTGKPCFTPKACERLETIISRMIELHGEHVYSVGQSAIMEQLGWQEAPDGREWIRVAAA